MRTSFFAFSVCVLGGVVPAMAGAPPKAANEPPTAALELPRADASFVARAQIPIRATAADTDGRIQKVYFYANGKLIRYMSKPPYAMVWNDVRAGTYEIKVVAEDNRGARTPTDVRTVIVHTQLPTVRLKPPARGFYEMPGNPIQLTAVASDPDGSIARVDFYTGDTLIGTDSGSPFQLKWRNVTPGIYQVRARARDNSGATAESESQTVVVIDADAPTKVAFNPSTVHDMHVVRYSLEVFTLGEDPETVPAVATIDLGKPPVVGGECRVEVAGFIQSLPQGWYVATVMTHGRDSQIRSAPSPPFRRQ